MFHRRIRASVYAVGATRVAARLVLRVRLRRTIGFEARENIKGSRGLVYGAALPSLDPRLPHKSYGISSTVSLPLQFRSRPEEAVSSHGGLAAAVRSEVHPVGRLSRSSTGYQP